LFKTPVSSYINSCFKQESARTQCPTASKKTNSVKEMDFLYILIFLRDHTHFSRLLTSSSSSSSFKQVQWQQISTCTGPTRLKEHLRWP